MYLETQKKKAEERKEKRKAAYEAMSQAEKRLDTANVVVMSIKRLLHIR